MAKVTVNDSTQMASTYEYVVRSFEEQRDQLQALAGALVTQLEPKDQLNPEDGCDVSSWRLAQVMYDMLSSTALATSARHMLLNE